MSGALCSHCNGSHVEGTTSSDIAMEPSQHNRIEPKKSSDRDWKEIRQRLERKIAAAAAQVISGRPGGADSRSRPRWATPPKHKEQRYYQVKQEDKLTTRGANPRTGVVSPSNRTDSSNEDHVPRPRVSQKWKVNGDQWVSVDIAQTPSLHGSPLSYKLAKTVSSAGSGSTDLSSSDDWEDRFVVYMPSANDPNPPSMTAEQIRLYQEGIKKLHATTSSRHEMDASKSSSGSPEPKITQHPKKISSVPVLQKGTTSHSFSTDSSQPISPPLDGPRQYFSSDEVGRSRVSPVTDNPKLKQKELFKKLREECFLGCVGVDEAGAKNPDEILLFPNSDDETDSQISPVIKPDRGSDRGESSGLSGTIQTSKLPQVSGQTLHKATQKILGKPQRATTLVIPSALTPAQPTKIPKPSSGGSPTNGQHKTKKDDIAVVSTSTAAAGPAKAGSQRSRTRAAPKASSRPRRYNNDYSRATSENDLFFESSSPGSSQGTNHSPAPSRSSASPDFLGNGSGDSAISPSQNNYFTRLNTNGNFNTRVRNGRLAGDPETPKTPHVAELDGQQVSQQLPSPPLSSSPSPPPAKPKAETATIDTKPRNREKRDTHTIRMEIRIKAEKARQGAAAAKTASERLAAARQHAERLAEARAAYDKAKSQSTTKKMDGLKQQKLNTEKINEARRAYKAAKAREEAEKQAEKEREAEEEAAKQAEKEAKRQAEKQAALRAARLAEQQAEARHKEAKVKSKTSVPTSSSAKNESSNISSTNAKITREPARKLGVHRQSVPEKKSRREDIGASGLDEPQIPITTSRNHYDISNVLSFAVFYLSFNKFRDFLRDHKIYSQILLYCENLFHMATHCFKVCKRLAEVWLEYKRNGYLPQSCVDDFGQIAGDVGQALVNLAVLCFVFVVVVRTAAYVVIVTNWIIWFCRPIGWVFGNLVRAVME
ncbi:NTP binding protein, putative [Talaromyces stipitatus ATCC 10500]|uniref:NTP binding protein, putative n=1 Tax=Talaromyces stipitatus (strain ATCC 10500 / CBS 375.48 / QM 6759 / NRRL 1006) TaxID=441959 RepID=B8M3R0_TALSN|nr:NTP binding protein, putative [Talaromyces stipitatus ATCC 10500]EED20653.1 NTP binding protein, putative [Talaromyces stipitatus ATCC 10500]